MPRQLRWRDLTVGLAASAAIVALTFVILVFGRLGRIPGETYRVYVRAEHARGIIQGSEVWLAGQHIGAVRRIEFLPPDQGTLRRVLLEVEMRARHREALRRDSRVEIKSGGSLIGAPVVYLSIGTPDAPIVEAGDTIHATDQLDLERVADQYAEVMGEIPAIMDDVRTVGSLLRSPNGTVGAALHERGGEEVAQARARLGTIGGRVRNRQGTIGLALGGREALLGRGRLAMARADSVRALLRSSGTSLGRFRRDSTLALVIADIRNEASIVRALLTEPHGTVGRMSADAAIALALEEIEREMAALLADLKRRPFRYLSF